ncbi:MAG: hypothetical protein ACFFGZ_09995 [Candidatus Thorarchaeota archaeon]
MASSPEMPKQLDSPEKQAAQEEAHKEEVAGLPSQTRAQTKNHSAVLPDHNQRDSTPSRYLLSRSPAEDREKLNPSEAGQKDRWSTLDDDPRSLLPSNTTWTDYAVDDDGNGHYDRLVISVGLLNPSSQDLSLFSVLKDQTGHLLGESYIRMIDVSGSNLSLAFNGQAINASGADGPYDVWSVLYPRDYGFYNYWSRYGFNFTRLYTTTHAYDPNDFESPAATITGFADSGLDTDGDQLFNELVIEVSIEVMAAGYYTAEVLLSSADRYAAEAADFFGSSREFLMPGNRTIAVSISTRPFVSAKLDGPYSMGYACIRGPAPWEFRRQHYLHNGYTTSSYQYTDFDPLPVLFTGVFRDRGADAAGTGEFDRLEITAQINVTVKRFYTISLILYPLAQNASEMAGSTVGLWDKGLHNVTIPVDARHFYWERVNTSFEIAHIQIRDRDSDLVDQVHTAYVTRTYNFTEFEMPIARLTGTYSDHVADNDGDGIYDRLIVDVGVNVTQRGYYRLELLLRPALSPNSQYDFWGSSASILDLGFQNVPVAVDMGLMYSLQLTSSFLVKEISIRDLRYNTIDQGFDVFITQNYQYADFNAPAIYLTGSYWAQGADTDNDGTFDELVIAARVNVRQGSGYQLEIHLRTTTSDSEGDYYDLWGETSGYWASGVQTVTVTIDASQVHSWRLITAFRIEEIRIQDSSDWNLIVLVPSPFITPVFSYAEFDCPGALLTKPLRFWDQGADTDASGKFDQLLITVEVNVSQAGYYTLSLNLRPPPSAVPDWYWYSFGDSVWGYWEPGIQNIAVRVTVDSFPTQRIADAFMIEYVELQDGVTQYSNTIDRADSPGFTSPYNYTDFDPANAYLTGQYDDQGRDTDLDGKFDELRITAEVMIRQAAYYRLELSLRPTTPGVDAQNYDLWGQAEGDWDAGLQNIVVTFDATAFSAWNLTTAFRIEDIRIWDTDNWHLADWVSAPYITTRVYSPPVLDPPRLRLIGNYFDQGVDTNGDGKLDQLRIIIEVNVTQVGNYHTEISLRTITPDPTWETHNTWASLDVYWLFGVYNLTFYIQTIEFYAWRLNSSFIIEQFSIHDVDWNTLYEGSNVYITQNYLFTAFEPPEALLTGSYWDQGVDTDNNGTFDQLVILIGVNVTQEWDGRPGETLAFELSLRTTEGDRYYYESNSSVYWPEGVQNISITFFANRLTFLRLTTAYAIDWVRLASRFGTFDEAFIPHVSRIYDWTEFDPPGALLSGYFQGAGVDSDDDGDFDFLEIAIGVNVAEAGFYELRLSLYSNKDYYYFDASATGSWQLGYQVISIPFDLSYMYAMQISSVYTINWVSIHDENDYLLDEAYEPYSTRFFTFDEFDPPAVAIIGIISDEGRDFGEDGLFDYLALRVAVQVKEPTVFSLELDRFWGHQGIVYDVWGSQTFPVFYPAGPYNVTVYVDSERIHEISSSSPWTTISITIRDDEGRPMNYAEVPYLTQAYDSGEFETEWHGNNRPPGIGGFHAGMEPEEAVIELGDSLTFQIEIADDQPEGVVCQLVVMKPKGAFYDSYQMAIYQQCQDCYPWKADAVAAHTFSETGVFEAYVSVYDSAGRSSGDSNVITIIVTETETKLPIVGIIPIRIALGAGIFIAGLLIALGVIIYIVRTPTRYQKSSES